MACANFPRGVEFRGSLAPFFFLHILKQKKIVSLISFCILHPLSSYRNKRPYPALRYSEKGYQVSEGEQPSASDLQKFK